MKDIFHVSLLWNDNLWIWIQIKAELIIMLVTQSCLTLCDLMIYSPPGSSVHGINQSRMLEWVVISFSRGSSQPMDRSQVSYTAGRFLTVWATMEAQNRVKVFAQKVGICKISTLLCLCIFMAMRLHSGVLCQLFIIKIFLFILFIRLPNLFWTC